MAAARRLHALVQVAAMALGEAVTEGMLAADAAPVEAEFGTDTASFVDEDDNVMSYEDTAMDGAMPPHNYGLAMELHHEHTLAPRTLHQAARKRAKLSSGSAVGGAVNHRRGNKTAARQALMAAALSAAVAGAGNTSAPLPNPTTTARSQPGGPCMHCAALDSPQWRRPLDNGLLLCNACGIYVGRHGKLPAHKKASSAALAAAIAASASRASAQASGELLADPAAAPPPPYAAAVLAPSLLARTQQAHLPASSSPVLSSSGAVQVYHPGLLHLADPSSADAPTLEADNVDSGKGCSELLLLQPQPMHVVRTRYRGVRRPNPALAAAMAYHSAEDEEEEDNGSVVSGGRYWKRSRRGEGSRQSRGTTPTGRRGTGPASGSATPATSSGVPLPYRPAPPSNLGPAAAPAGLPPALPDIPPSPTDSSLSSHHHVHASQDVSAHNGGAGADSAVTRPARGVSAAARHQQQLTYSSALVVEGQQLSAMSRAAAAAAAASAHAAAEAAAMAAVAAATAAMSHPLPQASCHAHGMGALPPLAQAQQERPRVMHLAAQRVQAGPSIRRRMSNSPAPSIAGAIAGFSSLPPHVNNSNNNSASLSAMGVAAPPTATSSTPSPTLTATTQQEQQEPIIAAPLTARSHPQRGSQQNQQPTLAPTLAAAAAQAQHPALSQATQPALSSAAMTLTAATALWPSTAAASPAVSCVTGDASLAAPLLLPTHAVQGLGHDEVLVGQGNGIGGGSAGGVFGPATLAASLQAAAAAAAVAQQGQPIMLRAMPCYGPRKTPRISIT